MVPWFFFIQLFLHDKDMCYLFLRIKTFVCLEDPQAMLQYLHAQIALDKMIIFLAAFPGLPGEIQKFSGHELKTKELKGLSFISVSRWAKSS